MFDSVEGGILPICVGAVAIGFAFSFAPPRWLEALGSVTASVVWSYVWYWIGHLITIGFKPEEQGGWDLVATVSWSTFAIPTSAIAFLACVWLRKRGSRHAS